MHILQHDPMAFLVTSLKFLIGNNVLTLTKSDSVEVLVHIHVLLLGHEGFDILDWVGTW